METRYFVKFIGTKHVAIAKAKSSQDIDVLHQNQYEVCTREFYEWVRTNTQLIEAQKH